ncbi:hypothetical protein CBR_g4816 [Chara braunii]|uniref:guanylate kinase n=1 Tax=Chara braunii TaxID=69332 RepID=A0A388KJ03_CHABU|nr:hypothetical protein CBR_g4816 [Chara braunii]|eukprot:GBG69988.1 hypothetical protein CBR_g4816 [Chara braunii]
MADDEYRSRMLKEIEIALGTPLGHTSLAPKQKPIMLVISGASGVGKDAVIERLLEVRRDLHFVVTATTRARRPNEVDGKDYIFVSKSEFERMIHENELLEHAMVYGEHKGVPKKQLREPMARGKDVVMRVDVQGAATVRSIVGNGAVFIFLVAESEAALTKRLIGRKTETPDKLLVRVKTAAEELRRMIEFDYVVVNEEGHLEETVRRIGAIIDTEKSRVHPRTPMF